VKKFIGRVFPIIACTMALGLGQNWKRVWSVIHLGCGDPSLLAQEIGRCGRDGKPELVILFAEPKRKNGKKLIESFHNNTVQSDNNQMDAFAIKPVCLCIALSIDNL
jgi:superfamily II DNA helicase RecQ